MTTSNLTALARKRIAAAAVEFLDGIGSYDCEYDLVARDAADRMGVHCIDVYDMGDIVERMTSLIDCKVADFSLAGF